MKKKLFLLAAFIALNVAAQPLISSSNDVGLYAYVATEPVAEHTTKASISLQLNVKKETLKVRSSVPILELAVNDLYGKKLLKKVKSNTLKLGSLTRGVYELEVKVEGTTFRKRIILQ